MKENLYIYQSVLEAIEKLVLEFSKSQSKIRTPRMRLHMISPYSTFCRIVIYCGRGVERSDEVRQSP